MSAVSELRAFNRFYTARIGLLDSRLSNSSFSLPQARVLYELAHRPGETAADLGRRLHMDKGQLSRILRGLVREGFVTEQADPAHRRRKRLDLTPAGHAAFVDLDRRASSEMAALLAPLDEKAREGLVSAARRIQEILGSPRADAEPAFRLRAPGPGDLGWIIHRQACLYAGEYGWDTRFEGLLAEIVGAFVAHFDPEREQVWIAERHGRILGSVFLTKETREIGKLRLLYVEPDARGLGIGTALVEACLRKAREIGYGKVRLWTNDVLTAARHIYKKRGFRLVSSEPHDLFGQGLRSEIWEIDLGTG